ncbi:MAG: cyanophycinase [Planctomycetes bacterium]|nr:cyanophycinase [Planctomycetota bacterium]
MALCLRTLVLTVIFTLLWLATFAGEQPRSALNAELSAHQRAALAEPAAPPVGPRQGALVIGGGGTLSRAIWEKFIELAGGPSAPIVIVPTASSLESFGDDWPTIRTLRSLGVKDLTVLHTRDRSVADSKEFIKPLLRAKGVWISGGKQLRLVSTYFGTQTQKALFEVLERGGVIGGTSAGATIQGIYASFPGRSDTPYEPGFGFLRNTVIDQHLLVRRRENDLTNIIQEHPDVLGIGIDEKTAIVVQDDTMDVLGESKVAIYDGNRDRDGDEPGYYFLEPGDRFDLRTRSEVTVPAEAAVHAESVVDGKTSAPAHGKVRTVSNTTTIPSPQPVSTASGGQ